MKIHTCVFCKDVFKQQRMGQKVCGPRCAIQYARAHKAYFVDPNKRTKKAAPTMTDEIAWAQKAFNAYIRKRDEGRGCISCGIRTGKMEAGHFRTRAAAPNLAMNTFNVHSQCSQCNNSKSGNIGPYRIGLIEKIGLERVERLECSNGRAGFTVDYVRRLKAIFNERTRHIDRLRRIIAQKNGEF